MNSFTIYLTYLLVSDTIDNLINQENEEAIYYGWDGDSIPLPGNNIGQGNSKYMYCNYIHSLNIDSNNPYVHELLLSFPEATDFKFLSDNINYGTGFTANKIYVLLQLVNNDLYSKPQPHLWRKYNITNQINSHVIGNNLTASKLTNTVFKIPLRNYNTYPIFKLNEYIQYSTKETTDNNKLSFGDEYFFFGNISTKIKAIAHTTEIPIYLNQNEFNSSTNPTWDNTDDVLISEIGIYDEDKNLVAIGKLNNPIKKNGSLSRTLLFAMDF